LATGFKRQLKSPLPLAVEYAIKYIPKVSRNIQVQKQCYLIAQFTFGDGWIHVKFKKLITERLQPLFDVASGMLSTFSPLLHHNWVVSPDRMRRWFWELILLSALPSFDLVLLYSGYHNVHGYCRWVFKWQ